MPRRIQCRRDRSWQTTPQAVYVGRPSRWGNPSRVGIDGDAACCVRLFEATYEHDAAYRAAYRAALAGKDLACWCKVYDAKHNRIPCHADVLLSWANNIPLETICA